LGRLARVHACRSARGSPILLAASIGSNLTAHR
jgi:hypothetical protein